MAKAAGAKRGRKPKVRQEETEAPETSAKPESDFNEADFRRDIDEVVRQKASAQEYAGNAGQAVKQCAERSGVHRKVIGMCASLKAMDPAKRTSLVADLMKGLNAMGYLDEGTLFDTPRKQAQEASQERESPLSKQAPPPPPDDAESQAQTNIVRLQNIKPLDGADAPGSYKMN